MLILQRKLVCPELSHCLVGRHDFEERGMCLSVACKEWGWGWKDGRGHHRKVGYSGLKQHCLWAWVTKYGIDLWRGPPSPPPLIHHVALGKKREDYVGGGHLSKSPFHSGNGGNLSGQKTVTKGRWLCKFFVYRR